jgi:outer membrane biosynthesis protein TonB
MQITLTFDPATLTSEDVRLISLMTGATTVTTTVTPPVVEATPEPEAEAEKPAPKKRAAKKAAPKPEPEPESEPEPEPVDEDETAPESPEVADSDDDVEPVDTDTAEVRAACEAALLARLGTGGPEARTEVREILATVGARRLSEVSDEDLPRLLTALQA